MKIKIVLYLLFVASIAAAQPSNEYNHPRFALKVDPLAMIDIISCPSYRIGTEFQLYKKFALSLEGGGYFQGSDLFKNVSGYTLKAETKFYLDFNESTKNMYISLEYFYKDQRYLVNDSIKMGGGVLKAKDYTIQKYINCATIKYGYVEYASKHILFDFFCGLGIRFKNVDCIGLTPYDIEHRIGSTESEFGLFRDQCGVNILPNIDGGVKIGYRFF